VLISDQGDTTSSAWPGSRTRTDSGRSFDVAAMVLPAVCEPPDTYRAAPLGRAAVHQAAVSRQVPLERPIDQ
jgi:hypothetical protein